MVCQGLMHCSRGQFKQCSLHGMPQWPSQCEAVVPAVPDLSEIRQSCLTARGGRDSYKVEGSKFLK